MASGKKGAKGNKTAHVLNLLTAPGEAPPAPPEETAGEAPAEAPASETAQPAGRPLLPPILEVAQANDDNIAQQIQQALEEEFSLPAADNTPKEETPVVEEKPASGGKMSQDEIEKMLASMGGGDAAPEPPAPAPEPEPPAPAPSSGGKMSQDEIEKMLASMGGGDAAPEPPAPAPEPEPPAPPETKKPAAPEPPPPPEDEEFVELNIMQTLVEEKAPRYIKMFGLCDCKRCAADVRALTLSNLVPKYIVVSKRDVIPMLTVYEGRYNSTIFAQLTRACKSVMDHPHHSRET